MPGSNSPYLGTVSVLTLLLLLSLVPTFASTAAHQPVSTPVPVSSPPLPSLQIRVREDDRSLPDGCTPAMVAVIVTGFIAAFNRDDQAALVAYVPAEATGYVETAELGEFGWLAVTGAPDSFNPGFGAENRDELLLNLAARHAQHDQLQLL